MLRVMVNPHRLVALVDLDAFFASVEVIEHPELEGQPLLIGGSPQGRGVVAAASYEARAYGCDSAMPMARALRLCPQATVLPARHQLYRAYSARVMAVLRQASDVVEAMSIDEAYLELSSVVRGLEEGAALMRQVQSQIREDLGLPCSIGLAANKMTAKIACASGKPAGFVVVPPGTERTFLAERPVSALPGVGPRSTERLTACGFTTLGQLASAPLPEVLASLGPWGAVTQRRAQGHDESPVATDRRSRSISYEQTFPQDIDHVELLEQEVWRMSARLAESLQRIGLVARTVTLKLRFGDFATITRSHSWEKATAKPEAVYQAARDLFQRHCPEGRSVRLVGVALSNLRPRQEPGQLAMREIRQDDR